jgi:membrane fusion protein (multidrug efflux system)
MENYYRNTQLSKNRDNPTTMKYIYLFLISVLIAACDKPASDLESKKKELEDTRNELISLREKIGKLEAEIRKEDPTFGKNSNIVLITEMALQKQPFEHFVDVRGAVESRKNVSLSALAGGKIERVWVTEGQWVNAGQTLITLEADVLRNSIKEVKTALDLANTVYEKQANLWSQKIGTEVQYLQAKSNKESLERKLETLYAQLDQMVVKAPFSGAIDRIDALVGEMASPGMPLVRMVSPTDMYVKADVSEDYAGKFSKGDKVTIEIPSSGKKVSSTITSVGYVINEENRTFRVEMTFPSDVSVKPNQVVIVSLRDYINPAAISVPTKIIQSDSKGQYVYVKEKKGEELVAKRMYITLGHTYNGNTEIMQGLDGVGAVISEGYRELTEGAEVKLAEQSLNKVTASN